MPSTPDPSPNDASPPQPDSPTELGPDDELGAGLGSELGAELGRESRRRPIWVLLTALLITAAGAWAMTRFEAGTSMEAMFDQGNPSAWALGRIMQRFSTVDELLILVTAEDGLAPEQASDRLIEFAALLEKQLRASPDTWAMCSRLTYREGAEQRRFVEDQMVPAGLYYLDDHQWDSLVFRLSPDQIKKQIQQNETMVAAPGPGAGQLAKKLLQDPLRLRDFLAGHLGQMPLNPSSDQAEGALLSDDGRSLLIRIAGRKPSADLTFTKEFVDQVQEAIHQIDSDQLQVELAGSYAIAELSQRIIKRDMIRSVFFAVIALHLVFLLMYRRWSSFPMALAPVAMGIVSAFGLFGFIHPQLTPLAAVAGGLLAGLGVDYAVHYLSHYSMTRPNSRSVSDALKSTTRSIGPAMAAACLTTAIGFGAICILGVPALRDFAMIGALGLALALAASLTVLPAILAITDPKQTKQAMHKQVRLPIRHWVEAISKRGGASMICCGIVLLVAALICGIHLTAGKPLIELESDLGVMHPQPNPPLQTHKRIAEKYAGQSNSLMIHLQAKNDIALVELAHAVKRRLNPTSAKLGITRIYGLDQWLPDPAENKRIAARAKKVFDADRIIADFNAAIDDSLFDPEFYVNYVSFLRRFITQTRPPTLETLEQYPAITSQLLARKTDARADSDPAGVEAITILFFAQPPESRQARTQTIDGIRRAIGKLPGTTLTGLPVVGHDTEQAIVSDLARLGALAGAAVLGWLLIYFRNPLHAMMCLLPVVFGLVMLLAFMVLTGERLNMINLIAIPLLIGIGVDDGIFLVSLYRRAKIQKNADLLTDLGTGAHAIITTSLTTALAFGSLMSAGTPAIQSLGRIVAIGVLTCLAGALFALTPLLMRLGGNSNEDAQ